MPPGIALQSDFTAGELSPSLLARVDLAKYGKGGRTMRNFMVQSHGPAVKRPGFELLDVLPGEAVLLEFAFNSEQSYALVFGDKWMRVAAHEGMIKGKNGGCYQIATPYSLEQARNLSYVQSADVLFIACQGVPPQKLMRYGHDDWRFETMDFSAPLPAPKWDRTSVTTTRDEYTMEYSYSTHPFPTAYSYIDPGGGDNGEPYYSPIKADLYTRKSTSTTVATGARFVNEAKKSDGSVSDAQLVTPYTYYVTAVNAEGKESELSEGEEVTGPATNNWQAGDYITLAWKAVPGAEEYRVYKSEFGGRPGYVATTGDTVYQDYNVTASLSEGAPKYVEPFVLSGESGKIYDYPGAVCIFEQRLVFASSARRPQTVWMSKSGDYGNFAVYSPLGADSPLELTIASQEVTPVNWMIPLRSLILGTPAVEWEISSRSDGAAFSAANAKASPQSYWGSSLRRAVVVGNTILHVGSSGSQVRSLQYEFAADSYGGMDLSIMAAHLLENHQLLDWAYQKNPDSIIWAVRSDGALLGLTFQAEHQISAWHQHDTQGKFKAICAVPNGFEHSLFAVVERDSVYYLERMAPRYGGGEPSGAVFLDCSLTYEGVPVQIVSGLEHLEGKEVGIFSQGAVEAPRRVSGGKITLDRPSAQVTVGLLYTADLETMPVEVAAQNGSSVGLKKQISTVNIAFHESIGVKAGLSTEPGKLDNVKWQEVKWRANEPYGQPPAPFSGVKHLTMPHGAENTLSICIRSELPTPVTVQSIMSRIEVKG